MMMITIAQESFVTDPAWWPHGPGGTKIKPFQQTMTWSLNKPNGRAPSTSEDLFQNFKYSLLVIKLSSSFCMHAHSLVIMICSSLRAWVNYSHGFKFFFFFRAGLEVIRAMFEGELLAAGGHFVHL